MGKKHNIIFNLSIDDLKELGIIKKEENNDKKKYNKTIIDIEYKIRIRSNDRIYKYIKFTIWKHAFTQ